MSEQNMGVRAGSRAAHGTGDAVSAVPASIPDAVKWRRGRFTMKCFGGHRQEPEEITVEGWVKFPFAIDRRDYHTDKRKAGWCITHLPTGYAARHLVGPEPLAKWLADKYAAAGDWNFTDPQEARNRAYLVREVERGLPTGTLVKPSALSTAKRAFVYPEETAQGMSPGTDETGTGSGPKDGQPGGRKAMRQNPPSQPDPIP